MTTIESLSRRLVASSDVVRYMFAGQSTFTLKSVDSGRRFTYKIKTFQPKDEAKPVISLVSLLTGPDNEGDFTYLGIIRNGVFNLTSKSRMSADAAPVKAISFTMKWLLAYSTLTPKIEFWHSGRCGRCGRKLTVPESVELGIGPECNRKSF